MSVRLDCYVFFIIFNVWNIINMHFSKCGAIGVGWQRSPTRWRNVSVCEIIVRLDISFVTPVFRLAIISPWVCYF
jgi:hypothetical protein